MHYFSETMKTWGITTVTTVLVFILIGSWLPGDTHVPIRGTNTIARGKNFPVEVPLTGNALLMEISRPTPPPLPKATHPVARLRLIHDDYYAIECSPEDILFTKNRPILEQTKGGWRIKFQ